MINRKIPWTSQPQYPVDIDRSNPLASRCLGAYLPANNNSRSGNPSRTVSSFGIGDTFLRTSSQHITIPLVRPVSLTGKGATLIGIVNSTNLANSQCSFALTDGSSHFSVLFRGDQAGDPISGATWNSPGSSFRQFQGPAYASGVNYVVAFTADTAGNFSIYVNGVLQSGSYSNAGTMPSSNLTKLEIGSSNGTGDYLTGSVFGALAFEGVLNAREIIDLSANLWQVFKAPPRRLWVVGAGGGGNVSLSLTGQSLTANLGALSASVTSSVTGNQTTLQQGTTTANVSQTLTGQAISLVQGSVSSDVSTVITGQTVSLAQGSVTDASSGNVTKALSGQSLSVSQGALTASISLALNGQSIVLSGGSVSPAVSSALAGQQSSAQQGILSANVSAGLTGQAVVLSNGTVAQAGSDVTKALTGQQLSIALGVLLEKKTIARPSSDTTLGAWLPSAGSSLYATLDEVSPDDADYIYTNSVSTCKIALNAVADPLTSSGQVVSYRVWSPNSNGLTVRLMQGATEIASWTHTVLPTSPTTYQQALTAGQCDAITDYSTLAIQLESV